MQKKAEKSTISAKIQHELKEQIAAEAKEAGQTMSEFIATILANKNEKEELHQKEIENMKEQIDEKQALIISMSARLEEAQKLLSQQQELQLMTQRQLQDMQQKQLTHDERNARRWWQVWK